MSHHIISGQSDIDGKASPILAKSNALAVDTGFPSTEIIHIVDSVAINAGATLTTTDFQFKKRTKILIFGTSNQNNISIGFEISPETTTPSTHYETFEDVSVINGVVYSFVTLFTDFFRLKITNNEATPTTVNLFATSKN